MANQSISQIDKNRKRQRNPTKNTSRSEISGSHANLEIKKDCDSDDSEYGNFNPNLHADLSKNTEV